MEKDFKADFKAKSAVSKPQTTAYYDDDMDATDEPASIKPVPHLDNHQVRSEIDRLWREAQAKVIEGLTVSALTGNDRWNELKQEAERRNIATRH